MAIRSFQADLDFGNQKEEEMLIKLKNGFNTTNIFNTKELYPDNKYCKWDFEDTKTQVKWELKSRRNTYNKYPTTIIPTHKAPKDNSKDYYFVFQFTDGDYYIKYDEALFKTFNKRIVKIIRAGIYDNPTPHFEIPITKLSQLPIIC